MSKELLESVLISVSIQSTYEPTKLCLEKLMIAGNHMSGGALFSVVRYGNVFGSRDQLFSVYQTSRNRKIDNNKWYYDQIYINNRRTVNFTIKSTMDMIGGEIFVPKLLHTILIKAPNNWRKVR